MQLLSIVRKKSYTNRDRSLPHFHIQKIFNKEMKCHWNISEHKQSNFCLLLCLFSAVSEFKLNYIFQSAWFIPLKFILDLNTFPFFFSLIFFKSIPCLTFLDTLHFVFLTQQWNSITMNKINNLIKLFL